MGWDVPYTSEMGWVNVTTCRGWITFIWAWTSWDMGCWKKNWGVDGTSWEAKDEATPELGWIGKVGCQKLTSILE